ncbi:WecB/TagA/CpsF family glycosyltransferase [Altericroceibacterium xinjiangense]|uniref:WecB/TagA/CpsF family glycosyltransferase n=1 Tax=Altericroceibacterium xinjiangense TaxID=762261 RepID=UPI000F7EE1DE|nr:WecB/TagA/CpsF family glycosyltransferase [Altericroceibacterium xinjiangense]
MTGYTYRSDEDRSAAHAAPKPLEAEPASEGADNVDFLELPFAPLDMSTVVQSIVLRPIDAAFTYVVTPNVDHVVRLQRSRSDLWPAYRGAWMVLCDSRILHMLARVAGSDLPVVPGSDLTVRLFEEGIGNDDPVAILGGRADMVAAVADRYGLRNVRHYDPPMGFIKDAREVARAVRFLVEAKARYSFLAVGSPQQEIIAHRVALTGSACGIGFCVGASLDFLSGEQDRAPLMMQHLALEWLYRLASDPRRMWRRYLIDGPQIFLIHQAWRRSMDHPGKPTDRSAAS